MMADLQLQVHEDSRCSGLPSPRQLLGNFLEDRLVALRLGHRYNRLVVVCYLEVDRLVRKALIQDGASLCALSKSQAYLA